MPFLPEPEDLLVDVALASSVLVVLDLPLPELPFPEPLVEVALASSLPDMLLVEVALPELFVVVGFGGLVVLVELYVLRAASTSSTLSYGSKPAMNSTRCCTALSVKSAVEMGFALHRCSMGSM